MHALFHKTSQVASTRTARPPLNLLQAGLPRVTSGPYASINPTVTAAAPRQHHPVRQCALQEVVCATTIEGAADIIPQGSHPAPHKAAQGALCTQQARLQPSHEPN